MEFTIQLVRLNLAITFDSQILFILKRGQHKIESKQPVMLIKKNNEVDLSEALVVN